MMKAVDASVSKSDAINFGTYDAPTVEVGVVKRRCFFDADQVDFSSFQKF